MTNLQLEHEVESARKRMPARIRAYLNARGITDEIIDRFRLGYDGKRITIPITNQQGEIAFIKRASDPNAPDSEPKMLFPKGATTELFGWEHLNRPPRRLIVCEGEFDRLVLESHGFPAVTGTAGASSFRLSWAKALSKVPEVLTSFDRDKAGRAGAERVARLVRHAKIINLPEEVGAGGDVTDYFARLEMTAGNFEELIRNATRPRHFDKPLIKPKTPKNWLSPKDKSTASIKAKIPIVALVGQYVDLRQVGSSYKGLCPFHSDTRPSFVVFPNTGSYHCFSCTAHGDVIAFLMHIESLTFPEAMQVLKHIES